LFTRDGRMVVGSVQNRIQPSSAEGVPISRDSDITSCWNAITAWGGTTALPRHRRRADRLIPAVHCGGTAIIHSTKSGFRLRVPVPVGGGTG